MDIVSDYRAMDRTLVGGKFHVQACLSLADVPVPVFFCLSRALFDRLIEPLRPRIRALLEPLDGDSRGAMANAAAALHRLITEELVIDGDTAGEIFDAFQQVHGDDTMVSVRACMLSEQADASEDSVSNPFAGISESFLYVTRDQLLARIRECWASAFAEKTLVYRLSQGLDPMDVSVAVGIQRMVFGERSFVLFTADPNTAAHDTLVVAGYGIGEGVVQESVPVDHYFINARTGDIRRVIADKATKLSLDRQAGHGLCTLEVPEAMRNVPCLDDGQLQRLRDLGRRIEARFDDWPQDIEGTFTADGELHVLQSRPIAIDYRRKRVWTGLNVTESYPGVSSPLTYSVAQLFYRAIFRDLYRRLGVPEKTLHRNQSLLGQMVAYVHGRVYYNLNAFYLLHQQSPLFRGLCPFWEDMVGLPTSYVIHPGEPRAERPRWRRGLALAGASLKVAGMLATHPRRIRDYKRWWTRRAGETRALLTPEQDAMVVATEFHRLWRDVGQRWGITLVNDAYIFTFYGITQLLMRRWGLGDDPGLLSNLLGGGEEVESVEIILSVVRIADYINRHPEVRESFLGMDEQALVQRYREQALAPELMTRLSDHIARYGDRSMEELKVENPSLREDPTVLFRGIRRFILSDIKPDVFQQAEMGKRADAEAVLERRFGRFSVRKQVLRGLLGHLRGVIAHRENARYCRSELFGLCKDMFRHLGAYLAARDAIEAPEDVYCLTIEEILGYVEGTGVDEGFHDTVERRRAQLERYRADEVPDTLTTDGALRDNPLTLSPREQTEGNDRVLMGLGSSMGTAAGKARIVLDPNRVGELPQNSILVARETDPGWLFLMLASEGMVVERGSMLSHTAITGRKFGIPTVVGVRGATTRIPDGGDITVNGGTGEVLLGEPAPERESVA